MKAHVLFISTLLVLFITNKSFSQTIDKADSLGLPGDNLNLYAVLDLFQKCETFEEFEKKLNQEDSKINNLDLNNDNKTDYIKVIDNKNGDNHAIVLQTPINAKENQDIAVIEIEKNKEGKILLQIIGNEDLYGKDYIIEPQENDPQKKEAAAKNPAIKSDTTVGADGKTIIVNNYYTTNNYTTTNNNNTVANQPERVYVSVNYWPMVRYIYTPTYVVYVSPWYWYSYPAWWNPWNPWYWHNYYWHHHNHHHHYYGWYHRTPVYRSPNTHNYYGQRKSSSETVYQHRTKGTYIQTYNSPNREKPGTPNPGYKPSNKPENPNSMDRTKPEISPGNKPSNKPNYNNNATRPETKPNNNKPQTKPQPNINNKPTPPPNYNKPASRPANPAPKPQMNPNTTKPQNKGGQKR